MFPGEDASHRARVLVDEHVLVEQVAVNDVAALDAGVQQCGDALLASAKEAIELRVLAECGAPAHCSVRCRHRPAAERGGHAMSPAERGPPVARTRRGRALFDRPQRMKQPAEHRCGPRALLDSDVLEEPSVVPLGNGIADVERVADRDELGHGDIGSIECHGGALGVEALGDGAQAKHQILVCDWVSVGS